MDDAPETEAAPKDEAAAEVASEEGTTTEGAKEGTTEPAADLLTRLVGEARAELLRQHCVAAVERAHGSCPGRGGDSSGGEPVPVHGLAFQPAAVGTRGVDDGPQEEGAGQEAGVSGVWERTGGAPTTV